MKASHDCAPAGCTIESPRHAEGENDSRPVKKDAPHGALETSAAQSTEQVLDAAPGGLMGQRLPAYARRLKAAIDAGFRPELGGGDVIVTSNWSFARAFDPGRVVCPPDVPPDAWSFDFLRGIDVVVLVPEHDAILGEQLAAAIRDSGASLVVLSVVRANEP